MAGIMENPNSFDCMINVRVWATQNLERPSVVLFLDNATQSGRWLGGKADLTSPYWQGLNSTQPHGCVKLGQKQSHEPIMQQFYESFECCNLVTGFISQLTVFPDLLCHWFIRFLSHIWASDINFSPPFIMWAIKEGSRISPPPQPR